MTPAYGFTIIITLLTLQEERLQELIKWSLNRKCFGLSTNSLNWLSKGNVRRLVWRIMDTPTTLRSPCECVKIVQCIHPEKNDAWSMFHSPQFIIVARLVNYVPARSLETKKANAADTSMLCQQKVKTMYFKTLNPRLVNLRQWFEVRFFSVVICKCCKFSTSLLGSCTWEFWMELKKIKFKVFVEPQ